jgi:hypothetical protein
MTDTQPLNVIMVVDVEALSGSHTQCSRSVRSDRHHVVRRHVPSIMAGMQPMNEREHGGLRTSKHRPEHTAL